jgi:hypothetical protein
VEAAKADLEWTDHHRDEILVWLQGRTGTLTDGPGTPTDEPGTPTDGPGTPTDGPGTPTDGSGNIATNTIVITVAFIIASLRSTQIFNYII